MQNAAFENSIQNFLTEQLNVHVGDGVVLAVSGGADSMALLEVMCRLRDALSLQLVAVHVHHGLRGEEADRDADFTKQQCEMRGIPLKTLHTDVAKAAQVGETVEQAGRRIRYAFLEEIRAQYGYAHIATAHHADDNLETVWLHMVRGSGLHGLCGIPPRNGRVIRPLLSQTRADIETYCALAGVEFVTDSTNTDTVYSRNFIRQRVAPLLKQLNPKVTEACTRMTNRLREEDAYLESVAHEWLQKAQCEKGYSTAVLAKAPHPIRLRALKRLIEALGGDCEEKHIVLADDILQTGGAVQIPCGVRVSVKNGVLTVSGEEPDILPFFETPLTLDTQITIGETVFCVECVLKKEYETFSKVYKNVLKFACDYDKIKDNAWLHTPKTGDSFHPVGGVGKTLKKYFNEQAVLPWQKSRVPIVSDQDGVVLVAGFSCDDRVKLDENTQRILLVYPKGLLQNVEEENDEYT